MNNFKKIGLSALAGSLVAISANAAELSVSGSVEVTYTDTGGTHGNELTGNSFGAKSDMAFKGSGDVGFGTVTMNRALSDVGAITTSYQTLDMGDMGVLSFDSTAGALVGVTANDDLLPTAYEENWTGVSSSGVTGVGSTNVIGYRNTYAGVSISAGYTNAAGAAQTGESAASGTGHGSIMDVYVSMEAAEGLTIGAGYVDNSSTNTSSALNTDSAVVLGQVVYSSGPVSAGLRMAENQNGGAGVADTTVIGYSLAFNVNENLAISYGATEIEAQAISATTSITNEVAGISAAYTMGAATIRMNHSTSDNDGNVKGVDDETTELSLALSF